MKQPPKEMLANSLEELLKTHSFDRVTVGDIANHCGLSRTTFYRHFKDKYECMNWVYQNRIEKIVEENRDIATWKNLVLQIATFLYDKKDYFSKVANYKEQNSLMDCIYKCGMEYATVQIQNELKCQEIPRALQYSIHMYMVGSVEGIDRWLKENCEGGPEFLAEVQCLSMPDVLRKYFK